jgi:preprotein translocase subunit SecA
MQQALKAQVLFLEGRDYIRQRKRVILVDQHTGRLMPDRRLSEGLHQAIEAKEAVTIRPRDVTSATITIQNYFRMYDKLAGMSGTAVTEGEEFWKIYELDVLAIPTNMPVIREDHADVVYRSEEAKLRAVARAILACHSRGQPVLVGTTSVEMSERLSRRLTGERLQMAALAPRVAYALQDAELDREERARLRETMNTSLGTMNSVAWNRLVRTMGLEPNALGSSNLPWIADYLQLPDEPPVHQQLERALRDGIEHTVLNAKEHTSEAGIIAGAGEPGAVTVATNMAGRGVDIKLGGELTPEVIRKAHLALEARGLDPFKATPGQMDSAIAQVLPRYTKNRDHVLAAGGLHVLGTERHEARRIDNQLRGRSGRQGEPGSSRFYLSLEDDLMRRFGRREMLSKLMETIGDDFPIEHGLVSRTIERAQTSVEGYNFDIRKHLLEYDDVLNQQRETIYGERLQVLEREDLRADVWRMIEGQVDEYIEKYGEESDQRRFLFAGLDDIMHLTLVAPKAPFQGPLAFGGQLTAFPPFTISFLADQFASQPLGEVQTALGELVDQAAADYGVQLQQTVSDTATVTLDTYEERLERFRQLLDEKIEDFLQLSEERGQPPDPRRLAQHLERTFPLRLSEPRQAAELYIDDMREDWLVEIEIEFHRQTCAGLLDRVRIRLPMDISLDRVRPAVIEDDKLADEMGRVLRTATKLPRDDEARLQLEGLSPLAGTSPGEVLEFVTTIKASSRLDIARLDRLVGHILGSDLEHLVSQYLPAAEAENPRLGRELDRLRTGLFEGKRGSRSDLLTLFRQLNDLVHLDISQMEAVLSQALAHEYDRWAQRQLTEIETATTGNPLRETTWTSIAEHLLSTHYTQKQVYDREHRRRATWIPRLPFSHLAQAHVANLESSSLRETVMASLRWAVEQREQSWGAQELQRWAQVRVVDLEGDNYDTFVRYLGERELGGLEDQTVEDLPPELYDKLRFIIALRKLGNQPLTQLPHADELLARLGESWQHQVFDTPVGELDSELQDRVRAFLSETGYLDDPSARDELAEPPTGDWDQETRDEVARFLGRRFAERNALLAVGDLEGAEREACTGYLQRRQYFVDEALVQQFLVHQRLADLPSETRQAALLRLARLRLDRQNRRKISNLDLKTRHAVTGTLQRMGMFTDRARREEFLTASLSWADLAPELRTGFAAFVARREWIDDGSLGGWNDDVTQQVIEELKRKDALADSERLEALPELRVRDVEDPIASSVHQELVEHLRADLAEKTMEELPAETNREIHQVLEERNYFIDQEKVGWFERKTLAQLPSDTLHGLEVHLGQTRLTELADTPYRELPRDLRESLEALFDSERVLADRAERLRLTQTGSLGQLKDSERDAVAHHLGRQWLVQLRDRRPPALPDYDRELVWAYLRRQGHFSDEFKEELFAFQRLDEFDEESQGAVESRLVDSLNRALDTRAFGELSPELQVAVRASLRRAGFFVDEAQVRLIQESPASAWPPDLRSAVETEVGRCLLSHIDGMPVVDWPAETQAVLWDYLDDVGYFADDAKRNQILERRLVDLNSEQYEQVVADLARQLEAEIGDEPVSELDDEMREGLREAVGAQGYFESDAQRSQVLSLPLSEIRRDDLDGLAHELGGVQLAAWAEQTLSDLPPEDREAVLAHLQARDWFQDREHLERLQAQRLRDLPSGVGEDLASALRRQQIDLLGQQPLEELDRGQVLIAHEVLQESGLGLEESQMRSLRSKRVRDLDQETYYDLLRDLGAQVIAGWGDTPFQELAEADQELLRDYLGRRIMSLIERRVLLHVISSLWVDYLTDIEDLRRGIGLEAYGQRDPLVEYKRRAYELFSELGDNIRRTVVRALFNQQPAPLRA